MKRRLAERVLLITGASAGLGASLATEAVRAGARVTLVARREPQLIELARKLGRDQALAVRGDVTREDELARAVEATHRAFGEVDFLIANAGFSVGGPVERLCLADYQRQFDTNVFGVLRSVLAVLPDLRRTRGAIGIMGSANGFLALPGWSAYCSSKFAVRALAESLRAELAPDRIGVTHFVPGFIATDFRRRNEQGHELRDDPVPRWLQAAPDRAARQMLRALVRDERERVVTGHARLGVALSRYAPELTARVLRLASRRLARISAR